MTGFLISILRGSSFLKASTIAGKMISRSNSPLFVATPGRAWGGGSRRRGNDGRRAPRPTGNRDVARCRVRSSGGCRFAVLGSHEEDILWA